MDAAAKEFLEDGAFDLDAVVKEVREGEACEMDAAAKEFLGDGAFELDAAVKEVREGVACEMDAAAKEFLGDGAFELDAAVKEVREGVACEMDAAAKEFLGDNKDQSTVKQVGKISGGEMVRAVVGCFETDEKNGILSATHRTFSDMDFFILENKPGFSATTHV